MDQHDIPQQIFTQPFSQQIPQPILQQINPINNQNNISFFNKIFTNKYLLLFILIIIAGIVYYFKKSKKEKLTIPIIKNNIDQYIIADLNGNAIKVSGEYVGDYKKPDNIKKITHKEYNDSSEENNNTKQYDLTQSEMKEITSKLKN